MSKVRFPCDGVGCEIELLGHLYLQTQGHLSDIHPVLSGNEDCICRDKRGVKCAAYIHSFLYGSHPRVPFACDFRMLVPTVALSAAK